MDLQAKYDRLVQLEKIVRAEIAECVTAENANEKKGRHMAAEHAKKLRVTAEGRLAGIRHLQAKVRELM